jgi:hypothetical protein
MARSPQAELAHNTALIADPAQFARDHHAASWLYLCGEEFAAMDGGMSYADVEAAVVDDLPRPTLVTCRSGARSSALVYLYQALDRGESAEQVLARAESDGAPFVRSDECRIWVEQGLRELSEGGSRVSGTDEIGAN